MTSTHRSFILATTAVALLAAPSPGVAQRWRTVDASRQLRGSDPLSVHVAYGAGRVDISPTASPVLYRMNLRYDAERQEPMVRFDSARRSLELGIRSESGWHGNHDDAKGGSLRAELSTAFPMDLNLELGAVQGDVQLGGLRLTGLAVKGGAADITVAFDQPNREKLSSVSFDVGAASLTVKGAGNARAAAIRVNVGVGALDYDLSGDWSGDVDVTANIALGNFTLRVPSDAGVRVDAKTFLAPFEKSGLERRGDTWYSPGYDQARRRVRVSLNAALGGFDLVRGR